ncbi:MAG: hypothetical protein JO013_16040 [Alphaproteobacteria bacterium]|nr:hypothetical protein [Alphaproteobacteria bacterium]
MKFKPLWLDAPAPRPFAAVSRVGRQLEGKIMILTLLRVWALAALGLAAAAGAVVPAQRETDGYTRYELLAPGSGTFRILYEISAVAPGARAYCNPIRPGSVASDERVTDRATGRPLAWRVVDGTAAATDCGVRDAAGMRFIEVTLARPVAAAGGEARLLIEKTYADPKSYFTTGAGDIVFDRPLGVKRNAVLLPAGYVLVSSNYPAQILEDGGRLLVSFWNVTPAEAPLRIVARRGETGVAAAARPLGGEMERAHQSRNIVYYLGPPETHSFALTHDYTETRVGTDHYVNIVRAGSAVANPSAVNLDTSETIPFTMIAGEAVKRAEPEAADVGPDTHAVLFRFRPVGAGESLRLRIAETYTDAGRYRLQADGTLLWERSLGRAENAVVLPAGWIPVESNMPCTVETQPDGRLRLTYMNPRPDELAVRLVARRVR